MDASYGSYRPNAVLAALAAIGSIQTDSWMKSAKIAPVVGRIREMAQFVT
jgi:hypothetical protein